jgi:broad specificity phosphatase PhoE
MHPQRIFLIRHGESVGNANKEIYKTVPDYAVRLTDRGINQATVVGKKLSEMLSDPCAVYYSPFLRTIETTNHILGELKKSSLVDKEFVREDARLREQEWHSVLPLSEHKIQYEKDRISFGVFHYRFPNGESPADVYDRAGSFVENMYRDFEDPYFPQNVLVVTHGMTMRILLMKLFNKTVEEVDSWVNPPNCTVWGIDYDEQTERLNFDFSTIRRREIKHSYRLKLIDL